jgi:post-segregation antitoxin (ccd killing protein)
MNDVSNQNSTWKSRKIPCGKSHNKTAYKTTVSLYLSKNLVKKARIHKLNISRITEQALLSVLDYLETQKRETITTESSNFLSRGSFLKESRAGSSVWYERRLRKAEAAGSNPARSTCFSAR